MCLCAYDQQGHFCPGKARQNHVFGYSLLVSSLCTDSSAKVTFVRVRACGARSARQKPPISRSKVTDLRGNDHPKPLFSGRTATSFRVAPGFVGGKGHLSPGEGFLPSGCTCWRAFWKQGHLSPGFAGRASACKVTFFQVGALGFLGVYNVLRWVYMAVYPRVKVTFLRVELWVAWYQAARRG